ncbi:MAG: hypothetical protein Q4C13_09090 [Clostridia bacterium]|nr:hypothetical protein [Clostridia bacterium]
MAKKTAVLVIGLVLLVALTALILLLALRDRGLMGEGVRFVERAASFGG